MSEVRAVYFDLDDTLCAYWKASRQALREAFGEARLSASVDEAMDAWRRVFATFSEEVKRDPWYQHYLESGEPTRTEHLRRTLVLLSEDDALAESISRRYALLRNEYLSLFPEAKPLLSTLRGKYQLGLITNGPADVQRSEIESLSIEGYFDHILIEGEMRVGKPARDIFDLAAQKWSYNPAEMLFVGNSFDHDVVGAKNAGWQAIWMNPEGEEIPKDAVVHPDKVITNLLEVLDYLGLPKPETSVKGT